MRRFLRGSTLFVLLCSILTSLVVAQTQTGKIVVVGVPDRFKSANKGQSTSGLKSVGLRTRVVLAPVVLSGTGTKYADTAVAVTSADWTLKDPYGVTKSIPDTATGLNGKYVYFIPDTVGDWTVTMTATTALGPTTAATAKIVAAKWVGAGITLSTTQSVPDGCACHLIDPTNFSDWSKSQHAIAVKYKVNEAGGRFSLTSCMSCHSVGYDANASGNNGFDDVAKAEGFTTIPTNAPGVHDTLVAKYPKSMALAGIQCENCHGPAGQHKSGYPKAGDNKLDRSLSSDVCAPCHFSSDRHGIGYAWSASLHAISTTETAKNPQYTDRPVCARCHTGQGYINEVVGGKAQPLPATGLLVYDNPASIGCSTCHDPHNGSNAMQLRAKTVGDACIGCHLTRMSSRGLHTAGQGSMLMGANWTPFSIDIANAYLKAPSSSAQQNNAAVGPWSGWEFPGYNYENSSHSDMKDRCAGCHMASSPSYLAAYNSNFAKADTLITKLGGHTFKVAFENIVGTDTTTILNPTGCEECHGEVKIEFVELTQAKTSKMLSTLYDVLPKRDSTVSATAPKGAVILFTDTVWMQNNSKVPASAKRKLTLTERAAAYNYQFVNNDGSGGVHNYNYAKGLLMSSIEQVQLGAGAASIVSVKDVPYDNGKRVQVIWNAFPAEKWSLNQVTTYGVWRKDPMLPSLSAVKKASNFTEMMNLTGQGSRVVMAGSVWSYVGAVPASGFAQYSYVAPTLFDSTKVSGQRWSVFYIAGYSKDNAVVYSTQPDSGYSMDNVTPLAPAGITAWFTANTVTLKWRANTEEDVYQYAIYRGTTASFDPTGSTPVAKVRALEYRDALAQTGVMYYYKISAIDASGNESTFGAVSVLTGIVNEGGIPTEFSLLQNYPNPFNPSTEIGFNVPKTGYVKLVVYGLSGEVVATLVNQTMSPGTYRVVWNGRTDDGRSVASGAYFYHLQGEGFTATKKMTLLK
jgi:predicted CXXCH cytochrome family protein